MTDEDTSQSQECHVDIGATFMANPQAAELVQPTDGAFHDPQKMLSPLSLSGPTSTRWARAGAVPTARC